VAAAIVIIVVAVVLAVSLGGKKSATSNKTTPASSGTTGSMKWAVQGGPTTESLGAVFALDDSHVWAVGGIGTAIHYDGTSWSKKDSGLVEQGKSAPYLYGVSGSDPEHVWATSYGLVYFFDGSSWSKQDAGGAKLSGIEMAGDRAGWAAGQKGTVVSFDGKSWSTEDSGTTADLTGVSATENSVWAVGIKGTILKADR